jgi:hypothetical protein
MDKDEVSKRKRERLELSLPVQVYSKESADLEWKEMTRLVDVTPFGAGFTLTRPTEKGRLLQLTMAMPRQLRCYDHIEPQYKVWALVRHVRPLPQNGANPQRYLVGVAFIGKRPPVSYEQDPSKRYDIADSPTESGLWHLVEPISSEASADAPDIPRETRYTIQIIVRVEVFNDNRDIVVKEDTVTENISHHGACVLTALEIERGRFVRITSLQAQISAMAVVRARRRGKDGIMRLHLQFVDSVWPIEGVD